jgi:hypothetical protein
VNSIHFYAERDRAPIIRTGFRGIGKSTGTRSYRRTS